MLLGGDEIGHSAQGNNNCYSKDNYLSWLNWNLSPAQQRLLEFARHLIAIRKQQPALSRRHFFRGSIRDADIQELYWLDSNGRQMDDDAWNQGAVYTMDNSTNGNHVLAYQRAADGSLSPAIPSA